MKKYKFKKSAFSTSKLTLSTMGAILIVQKLPFIIEEIPAVIAVPIIAGALSSAWDYIRHGLPGLLKAKSRFPG